MELNISENLRELTRNLEEFKDVLTIRNDVCI